MHLFLLCPNGPGPCSHPTTLADISQWEKPYSKLFSCIKLICVSQFLNILWHFMQNYYLVKMVASGRWCMDSNVMLIPTFNIFCLISYDIHTFVEVKLYLMVRHRFRQ